MAVVYRKTTRTLTGISTQSANVLGLQSSSLYQSITPEQQVLLSESLVPQDVEQFKTLLFDSIVIPLLKNNDDYLKENIYIITLIKSKMKELIDQYSDLDLSFYQHIVDLITLTFQKSELAMKYDEYLNPKSGTATLGAEIKRIFLKAEFELYNIIFGKDDIYVKHRIKALKHILYKKKYIKLEDIKRELKYMNVS